MAESLMSITGGVIETESARRATMDASKTARRVKAQGLLSIQRVIEDGLVERTELVGAARAAFAASGVDVAGQTPVQVQAQIFERSTLQMLDDVIELFNTTQTNTTFARAKAQELKGQAIGSAFALGGEVGKLVESTATGGATGGGSFVLGGTS